MGKSTDYQRDILNTVIYLIVVLATIFLINTLIAQQIQVLGSSMEHTLHNKDRMILEKLSYRFGEPERFDIIVFTPYESSEDTCYIKRIIGMPGETVQIIDGKIYIDGTVLEESYGMEQIRNSGIANEEITLGKEEYFVLGDNRNNSRDSRYEEIGNISREDIVGRAFVRIWPINKIELMKHQ